MTTEQAKGTVYNTCIAAGLTPLQAGLVVAQGIQESANYTSNVFKKNNNAFGMKMPSVRKSPYILGRGTAAPASEAPGNPNNVYARYASLEDSTKDLLHRHAAFKIKWADMTTPEAYISFLQKTAYFQGSVSTYKNNVAAFLKQMGVAIENTVATIKKKA